MSSCDTCVSPDRGNGLTARIRIPTAEAFELEGMDPCYVDIDGLWLKDGDGKHPESVSIADEYHARLKLGGRLRRQSDSGLEPASVVL